MKLNIPFKKSTPVQQTTCTANQNKPECSLIEELRSIQEELRLMSFNYDEREKIMCELIGQRSMGGLLYDLHRSSIYNTPLIDFIRYGYTFRDTKVLEYIINQLQKFKECVESDETKEQCKDYLTKREKEIKEQLGIK